MSVDEYACLEEANGVKLVMSGNRWWRKVRPGFFRPLFLFEEILPSEANPPITFRIGGAQYLAPKNVIANSKMSFLQFENPQSYSTGTLSKRVRYQIRKAESNFSIRRLDSAAELTDQGHGVYRSFHERTGYGFNADRLQVGAFKLWAEMLYRFPQLLILGAYDKDGLAAVSVSYLVNNVLFYSTFFSKTEALSGHVSDLMLHCIREGATASPHVRFIFAGMATMGEGLQNFYRLRGVTLVSRPAILTANPIALLFLKCFFRHGYSKLLCAEDCE